MTVVQKLFFLGMVFVPFSDIAGLPFLGEVQHEVSAYIFVLALVASSPALLSLAGTGGVLRGDAPRPYLLPSILLLLFGVVFLSAFVNAPEIVTTTFRGRGAPEKFISALVLLVYGFALAWLTYYLADRRWQDFIARPLAISVLLCAAFSVFEMAARWFGIGTGIYQALSLVVHSGSATPPWETRLRSVAFEPPWFGNYAGFVWPWLLAAARSETGVARRYYFSVWMVLNVLVVLSMARTAFLIVGGCAAVWVALRFVYLPPRFEHNDPRLRQATTLVVLGLLVVAILTYIVNLDVVVHAVMASDTVTNISRLSSIVAAFGMFGDRPFLGFGLGQYGFHVQHYLPFWGYYSYEFTPMFTDPRGEWPSSYSVFARFAAELGVVGLVAWLGLWLGLARTFVRDTLMYQALTGKLPSVVFPLVASCFCVLLAGLATESLRFPMIWVTMGLGCRYLAELRRSQPASMVVDHRPGVLISGTNVNREER